VIAQPPSGICRVLTADARFSWLVWERSTAKDAGTKQSKSAGKSHDFGLRAVMNSSNVPHAKDRLAGAKGEGLVLCNLLQSYAGKAPDVWSKLHTVTVAVARDCDFQFALGTGLTVKEKWRSQLRLCHPSEPDDPGRPNLRSRGSLARKLQQDRFGIWSELHNPRLDLPVTMPSCSTSANRKHSATGSFMSPGLSLRYSLSGGCCDCMCCKGFRALDSLVLAVCTRPRGTSRIASRQLER